MSLVIEDSSAQACSPFQARKGEQTRRRKKAIDKSEGLRKKRNKAKHQRPKDAWVSSRKKMVKVRNNRKENRRLKVEESLHYLPVNETAAAASRQDPVSDAAPTTPLRSPVVTAPTTPLTSSATSSVENMAKLNLDSRQSSASGPAYASKDSPQGTETDSLGESGESEVTSTKLQPVSEATEEDAEDYAPDTHEDCVKAFSNSYTNSKTGGARNHTNSKNNKKLRRAKRGSQDVMYKWAVSHSQRNKGWKNRRKAARRAKTEFTVLGELLHDASPAQSNYSAPQRRATTPKNRRGKWVAVSATKGDCAAIKPAEDLSGLEGVVGRVEPTPKPVEKSNAFAVLSRRRNRNPRWRGKWRKKKVQPKKAKEQTKTQEEAAQDQPTTPEGQPQIQAKAVQAQAKDSDPAKEPPAAKDADTAKPEPKETKDATPAVQKRRRRKWHYRKKKQQTPTGQEAETGDTRQASFIVVSTEAPTTAVTAPPPSASERRASFITGDEQPSRKGRIGRRKRQRWKKRQANGQGNKTEEPEKKKPDVKATKEKKKPDAKATKKKKPDVKATEKKKPDVKATKAAPPAQNKNKKQANKASKAAQKKEKKPAGKGPKAAVTPQKKEKKPEKGDENGATTEAAKTPKRNRRRYRPRRNGKQQQNTAKTPQTTPKKAPQAVPPSTPVKSKPAMEAETPVKGEEKTARKRRRQQRRRRQVWIPKSKATSNYIPGPTAVDL